MPPIPSYLYRPRRWRHPPPRRLYRFTGAAVVAACLGIGTVAVLAVQAVDREAAIGRVKFEVVRP